MVQYNTWQHLVSLFEALEIVEAEVISACEIATYDSKSQMPSAVDGRQFFHIFGSE